MHSYSRDLGMLKDRRFTLLLATRTISMLGSSFAPVALAFSVLALPGSNATTLSLVLTAEALPMVVFMLVGGVIADRFPRHRVIMIGETVNAMAFFGLSVMIISGWTPLPVLMGAAALSGVAIAILFPALAGIVPELVPADRLQTANALIGLGTNSARVAGLVLSGGTVVLIGGGWALAVSGAMFAGAALMVSALRLTPAERSAEARYSVLADLRAGWREFISRQWLWVVVAQFSVLIMAMQAAHGVLGPLMAKEHLGGAPAWSAILAGEAVGMICGVFIALRLQPKRPILVIAILSVPTALPYVLLGSGAPLWAIIVGAALMGVCFDVIGVLWNTTMQREVPTESLSRVSSYDALGSLMFGPIGLLIAGPLSILIGLKPAILACAAVVVLSSLAALLSPGVRGLRAPAPAAAT
ncbi:MFS transporter [Rhizohabitans arisaemae]|uniref:MFS transporter n=1 Tax=Rhizohabitans arisaemae TaxID=2720610 RepID=UPI0024B0B608|nr:MFS transporter [Rhizohabitans arisaemae]